jgi:hypothetical protein
MSLLNQIENNEVDDLKIDAMAKEAFEKAKPEAFLDALEKNNSIRSVRLEGDFLACLRADVRSNVIKAIGKLSSVREIYLGDSLLLAPDLTEMLTEAKSVTTLNLHDCCIQGAPEFFDALEAVLFHHVTLKDFELKDCMASNQSVDLQKLKDAAARTNSCGAGINPAGATANTATAKSA